MKLNTIVKKYKSFLKERPGENVILIESTNHSLVVLFYGPLYDIQSGGGVALQLMHPDDREYCLAIPDNPKLDNWRVLSKGSYPEVYMDAIITIKALKSR
jgi:hypothetical protein